MTLRSPQGRNLPSVRSALHVRATGQCSGRPYVVNGLHDFLSPSHSARDCAHSRGNSPPTVKLSEIAGIEDTRRNQQDALAAAFKVIAGPSLPHVLPVISTCETHKTGVESMLDTV